ncbi:MAG: alpha/beta hydrolase [Phycisphaerales bacterium]|nr:alpha/beta hydrolase [Phycisphaerales bacterium]
MPEGEDVKALLDPAAAKAIEDWVQKLPGGGAQLNPATLDAPTLRQAMAARHEPVDHPAMASIEDLQVQGTGSILDCRLYRPMGPCDGLLVWNPGGGWVLGGLDRADAICRQLADGGGCCVLSVAYRLAPEHRFPAAFYDAASVWRFAQSHASELGVDVRQLAIGGDSVGGALAASVCLMAALDEAPLPAGLLQLYPVVDADLDRPSLHRFGRGDLLLSRAMMGWFWDQYQPDHALRRDWRASPLMAPNLGSLPPATILLAQLDPLVDSGLEWAHRLREEGVPVELQVAQGLPHAFGELWPQVASARDALRRAAKAMTARLEAKQA